jgi:mono/diheme cytochrome c family protein
MHIKFVHPDACLGCELSVLDAEGISEIQMQAAKLMGALALMAGSTVAGAQEWGDARQGLRYAQKMCAECHAVSARQPRSPLPDAPPFQAIANTPGMTGTALAVWFRTSHPVLPKTMPNLVIEDDDMDNVIAYILSLRGRRAQ